MTTLPLPAEDADASLLKRSLVSPYGTTYPKALAALNRLTAKLESVERELSDTKEDRDATLVSLQEAERERDEAQQRWEDCHARNSTLWQELNGHHADALAAEAREAALREALEWLRMALGWAVFRDDSNVWASNEMRDIQERVDAALATDPGATE